MADPTTLKPTLGGSGSTGGGKATSPPTVVVPTITLNNIYDLVNNSLNYQINGTSVAIAGYYTNNDNGGGAFTYSSSSTALDDGGSVIKPANVSGAGRWIRQFGSYGTPEMWGAKPNNSTFDSSSAMQLSIRYLELNSPNYLKLDAKTYYLSGNVSTVPTSLYLTTSGFYTWNNSVIDSQAILEPHQHWTGERTDRSILAAGFYKKSDGKRCNLTIQGAGSATVLYTDTRPHSTLYDYFPRNSIFLLGEQISSINIFDLCIDRSGYTNLGRYPNGDGGWDHGVWVSSNTDAINYDCATNNISITGVTFINCHRAITAGRTIYGYPYGIRKMVVNNNKFLHPRGADSADLAGGGQIVYVNQDIEYFECKNNYAEGNSTNVVYCSSGYPKDGFIFNSGKNSVIQNNVITRMGIEHMYGPLLGRLGSTYGGPLSTFNIPPVGGQTTITFMAVYGYYNNIYAYNYALSSLSIIGLVPGANIALYSGYYTSSAGNVIWMGSGQGALGNGFFRVDSLNTSNTAAAPDNNIYWSMLVTRLSGISGDTGYGNAIQYNGGNFTGVSGVSSCYFSLYGYGTKNNITCRMIDNTIYGACILSSVATGQRFFGLNGYRADCGTSILTGNTIYGECTYNAPLWVNYDPTDPTVSSLMAYNTCYYYNQLPVQPLSGATVPNPIRNVPYSFLMSCSGSVLRNNTVVMWVDSLTGTNYASTVNGYYLQQYYNSLDNTPYSIPYPPVKYSLGGTFNYLYKYTNQKIIDNTIICTIPTSGYLIEAGGTDLAGNPNALYNTTLSGNLIIGCADVVTLRTYSTTFIHDKLKVQLVGGTIYTFNRSSLTTDDSINIIKPNDINISTPGRWIRNVPAFSSISQLITASTPYQSDGVSISVLGYYLSGDSGGGNFTYSSSSTAQNDAGAIVQPSNISGAGRWIRQFGSYGTPEMWGAKPNVSTFDSSSAMQLAVRYLELNSPNYLKLDAKTYYLSGNMLPVPVSIYQPATGTYTWDNSVLNDYPNMYQPWENYTGERYFKSIVAVGYYKKDSGKRSNLTIQGAGSATVLYTDTVAHSYLYDNYSPTSIFYLAEQIDSFNIFDLSIDRSGRVNLGGVLYGDGEGQLGIYVGPNNNDTIYYDCSTNNISITGVNFINCHRALTSGRTLYGYPYGIRKIVLNNNKFLYPRGSDSDNFGGGGQMVSVDYDAEYFECKNNYAEGCSSDIVNCYTGFPVDGFTVQTGKTSLIQNNTATRCGVETFIGPRSPGFTSTCAGPLSTFNIPAVGGQTTITFPILGQYYDPSSSYNQARRTNAISWFNTIGFGPGRVISLSQGAATDLSGNYVSMYGYGTPVGNGFFRIDTLNTSNTAKASDNALYWSMLVTRLSGVSGDSGYLNNFQYNKGDFSGVKSVSGSLIQFYNYSSQNNVSCKFFDNTIYGGAILSGAYHGKQLAGLNGYRSNAGTAVLTGNVVYGNCTFNTPLWTDADITDCKQSTLMAYNTVYFYNQLPPYPLSGIPLFPGGVSTPNPIRNIPEAFLIGCSGAVVRNNTVVMWVDSLTGTNPASTVNGYYVQQYYNGVDGVAYGYIPNPPVLYLFGGTYGVSYRYTNQKVIDNTVICTIPTSAYLISVGYESDTTNYGTSLSGNKIVGVANVSSLRTLVSYIIQDTEQVQLVDGSIYQFYRASTATDDGANVIKPNDLSSGTAGRWIKTYPLTVLDIIAGNSTNLQVNGNSVTTIGYYTSGDNGGGAFTYSSSSTALDDGGSVIKPANISGSGRWIRQFGSYGTPEMWGAKPNVSTFDSSSAMQLAIRYLELNSPNYLKLDAKTYYLTGWYNSTPWNTDVTPVFSAYNVTDPNGRGAKVVLGLGYYSKNSGKRTNLTIQGAGSGSVLYVDTIWVNQSTGQDYGMHTSIINICEQVDSVNIFDLTIDRSGYIGLGGKTDGEESTGLFISDNYGGYAPVAYDCATQNISITGVTFTNCHRAINSGRTVPGVTVGIRKMVVSNCRFLYPRGSDSDLTGGGGQIAFANYDTEILYSDNNYVEGSSNPIAGSPNRLPKDGWWFRTGKKAYLRNNTLTRLGVESIFGPSQLYQLVTGNLSAFTFPAVGNQVKITFYPPVQTNLPFAREILSATNILPNSYIAIAGGGIGTYVDSSGNKQILFTGGSQDTNVGYYQINSIDTSNTLSASDGSIYWSTIVTRVSGLSGDTGYANRIAGYNSGNYTGLSGVTLCRILQYASSTINGVQCYILDNTFKGDSISFGVGDYSTASHVPCYRANTGYSVLTGNKFYSYDNGGFMYTVTDGNDPYGTCLMAYNTAYVYDQLPPYPLSASLYPDASARPAHNINTCFRTDAPNAVIRNNTIVMWVDSLTGVNYATTVNVNLPQQYWNSNTGVTIDYPSSNPPVIYCAGGQSWITGSNQKYIDNNIVLTIPLSGNLIYAWGVTDLLSNYFGAHLTANLSGTLIQGFADGVTLRKYSYYIIFDGLKVQLLNGSIYQFYRSSFAVDDGVNVLKPNDIGSGTSGRWILQ